jgi:hypothetical protein
MDQSRLSILNTPWIQAHTRGATYSGPPITHHCTQPWRTLVVNLEGDCFLCRCEAHLPIPVGKITDFENLEDVWNSDTAKELQQTIIDKTFTYCAVTECGIIENDILIDYSIGVNIDESCNLACPSCRRSMINHTSGPLFELKLAQVNYFVGLISKFKKRAIISMTGNGDPLASLIMRPLILNWEPYPEHIIELSTNGLLMKKLLPTSSIFANIKNFKISVDAGTQEVYENVRRPGKFSILRENLDWLAENRQPGVRVDLHFCISASNASDMINFANMCKEYNFTANYAHLNDWNTFDNFSSHDAILNNKNPLHDIAIEQLKTVASMKHVHLVPTLQRLIWNKTT